MAWSISSRAVFLAVLTLSAETYAAIPVDIYQAMDSGNSGELLTSNILNACSHGGESTWNIHGAMWVSTNFGRELPVSVLVGGTNFPGTSGNRSWMFNDKTALNYVACDLTGFRAKITIACYYTPGVTIQFGNQFDTIILYGDRVYSVLQTINDDGKGPYLRAHSCTAGSVTTFSPGQIKVAAGKTYWVNLRFDGDTAKTYVAAFDPDHGFAQVGETVVAESTPNSTVRRIEFGRGDNHRDNPTAKTQSYLSQILIDYSRGAFPLVPGRR
jgi:hypothetical protein